MRVSSFKIFITFILLAILGVFVLPKLSVKLNPSNSLPSITISYKLKNASPTNLEHDITSKLEAGFSTLKGLQKINSKSSRGNYVKWYYS